MYKLLWVVSEFRGDVVALAMKSTEATPHLWLYLFSHQDYSFCWKRTSMESARKLILTLGKSEKQYRQETPHELFLSEEDVHAYIHKNYLPEQPPF